MFAVSSEWDAPVVEIERLDKSLSPDQQGRLIEMVEVLRDYNNLKQIAEIKMNCEDDEYYEYARVLFEEFTQKEQQALWVAPTYGGIFTTHERKVLKNTTE